MGGRGKTDNTYSRFKFQKLIIPLERLEKIQSKNRKL
jgi:hypothetical protein